MEGVLELEGLWDVVSGKRQRPSETRSDATPSPATGNNPFPPLQRRTRTPTWVTSARRAWITIDLSIANGLRHITKTFSKDPAALWKHLERNSNPTLGIQPKDGETGEETIERVEKAGAALLESVSEAKVDELLGALVLFKLTPNYKDLVNLV